MVLNKCLFIVLLVLLENCGAFPVAPRVTNTTERHEASPGSPFETQSAQCTITSGDVQASAQATITKKLEGVCGTQDMQMAFQILESRMLQEMYNLRLMIQNPMYQPPLLPPYQYVTYVPPPSLAAKESQTLPPLPPIKIPDNFNDDKVYFPEEVEETKNNYELVRSIPKLSNRKAALPIARSTTTEPDITTTTTTVKPMQLKYQQSINNQNLLHFKPIDKPMRSRFAFTSRDFEVYQFNNTIQTTGETKIFTYFWKIEQLKKKLQNNVSAVISPIFTISGLHLKIKATLNYMNRDFIHFQLEQLSKDDEEFRKRANVVLETGSLFQDIDTKKHFKHKIIILNQVNPNSDLISKEFWNSNTGFQIPINAILANSYSKDDSILIKIVIYL